jgi:hypothetical protein
MRRREVMPRADALSSRPRREVFKDEIAKVVMTAFLRSATIEGCASAAAQANKGLKMFVKGKRGALFAVSQSLTCASEVSSKPLKNVLD